MFGRDRGRTEIAKPSGFEGDACPARNDGRDVRSSGYDSSVGRSLHPNRSRSIPISIAFASDVITFDSSRFSQVIGTSSTR